MTTVLYFCEQYLRDETAWSEHPELITDDLEYARSWVLRRLSRQPSKIWWDDFHKGYERLRQGFLIEAHFELNYAVYRLRPVHVEHVVIGSMATLRNVDER